MSHSSDLIAEDIHAYLKEHENKELLRFLTCGSVDDGKSTLIGRLLYDSKMIYEDQLAAIQKDSSKYNTTNEDFDLALLTDGLQAEREQGITIDVAYRYFSTNNRKFIIGDTPGHEQYTRNMATGASTCDLAIILIDARHGIQTQTRRHSYIVSLLGIKHVVIAVNKMDIEIDGEVFNEDVYNKIVSDYTSIAAELGIKDPIYVPMSALKGDNVVNKSTQTPWYKGQSLMEVLETVKISEDKNFENFRFPVQYVNRPNLNFRGFCGTISSGEIKPGDEIVSLPSGMTSKVKSIVTYDGELECGFAGQAVTLTTEDEIDISRGNMLVKKDDQPEVTNAFTADLVWMAEKALEPGREYYFKVGTKTVSGTISHIEYRTDVNTWEKQSVDSLQLNEIARCVVNLSEKMAVDEYKTCRATGAFIIIDRLSNTTMAAGMIASVLSSSEAEIRREFSEDELTLNAYVREQYPHWECIDISKLK
ncbi:sulfate adenylyltransferase subunit CysN [Lentisphaera profundi]|uniref:Sulfate adenylyltransferase subunit 1 n=1 Tax=Lentisphaera profundi TaxID=1658616 RepID=A0ABY7VW77_9BACT|nr:sulfate adenylyltransferase subunit CysN [Lentisphaera profundi]WDE97972.1 sulfate adenylyltransferase subunit CysN [Lentisphaera profundi]